MQNEAPRILFVDDDRGVLQGLERMLFEMAEEWDMVFVDAPEAALAALDESHFDVIVSDVRMPGMDGGALLSRVRESHPNVVRILLTGYSELEATLRAVPVAHRFLTKPCKPAVLVDVLRRSCALQRLLTEEGLRNLVGGVSGLPVDPEVYARLTTAVTSTSVEASDIASIVSRDVGLSSKVLHLTNSAFFGTRQSFVNIDQAVAFIGVRMLRELVLSAHVFSAFEPAASPPGFSLEAEQRHSLACAGIARAIAVGSADAESAFIAGMLHDIGKLVWATHAPVLSHGLSERRTMGRSLSPAVEESASGTKHGQVGAYLLGLWGLEESVVEAVAHHHDPAILNAARLDLTTIVHVADALAHEIENERAGLEVPSMLDTAHLERLGVLGKVAHWRQLGRDLWDEEARAHP
jgi:putative nucleotidyltransferase with HDIG domain